MSDQQPPETNKPVEKQGANWKHILRRWGPTAITLIIFALGYEYLRRSGFVEGIDLAKVRPEFLGLIVVIRILNLAVLGLMLDGFAQHIGTRLDVTEWFGLTIASSLVNSLTPVGGGAALRAGYLKLRYELPVARLMSFFAVTSLMNYLVSGIFGLVLLIPLSQTNATEGLGIIGLALAGLVFGPILALIVPLEKIPLPGKGKIQRWIGIALDGWRETRSSPVFLARQLALSAIVILLQGLGLLAGLTGLGKDVNLVETLFIGVLVNAWRVTPGPAVGPSEAVSGLGAWLVGIDPALGVTAVLLNRLANWLLSFTLGVAFTYVLSRRLGRPLSEAAREARIE